MLGVAHKKWKVWLQQLIVGISLAGALTSCSASSTEVRARLSAVTEKAILNDFLQAIHGPAVALEPGRTVTGELTSTDPVFLITVAPSAEYRTYFDLYRVTVDKPGDYEVTVVPKAGNAWFVQPIVIPIIRVLAPAGEVLATESSPHASAGRPHRSAMVHLSGSGDCFVFVGADNSEPGSVAGYDKAYFTPGFVSHLPLASCGEGKYSVSMKPIAAP